MKEFKRQIINSEKQLKRALMFFFSKRTETAEGDKKFHDMKIQLNEDIEMWKTV